MTEEDLEKIKERWRVMPSGKWSVKQFRPFGAKDFLVRESEEFSNKEFEIMAEFVSCGNMFDRNTLANSKKDIEMLLAYIEKLKSKIK